MAEHVELEPIPSAVELVSIANALRDFLVAARRDEDIVGDPEMSGAAILTMWEICHRLCQLEKFFNPRRIPYGSPQPVGFLFRGWPEPVLTRLFDLRDRVYKIIRRWGVTEICEDRPWSHRRLPGEPANVCVLTPDDFGRMGRALESFVSALQGLADAPLLEESPHSKSSAPVVSPLDPPPADTDPLTVTRTLLPAGRRSREVFDHVVASKDRKSTLMNIAAVVYKAKSNPRRKVKTARKQVGDMRARLDNEDAPLRINLDRGAVSIVPSYTTKDDATKM